MSAAVSGAAIVYYTFDPSDPGGWQLFGGTSLSSPLFSGIVALTDQLAGHRIGYINNKLYLLANAPKLTGIVDVTSCTTTFGPFTNSKGVTYTVQGANAGPGYDLASGLGTVDGARFIPALALIP